MTRLTTSRIAAFSLLTLFCLTALIYWRGLSGPFLLDDPFALQQLAAWQEGKQSIWQVLFSNESFLMHRALAMATLALNVVLGGDSTFSFKMGNLLHHLLTGFFIFLLLQRMFLRDARLRDQAALLSVLVTALWMLHPLHVSTVLYIIQRMAQVAALCCVIGLWLYMLIRERMQNGTLGVTTGLVAIWLAIPVITFLGIQGKQNAAILPLLCLVLEIAYFSGSRLMPRALQWFYACTVVLPALAVVAALWIRADAIFLGYWVYDFDMSERLLSEARAMWVFVTDTLMPYPPAMGIYGDDFEVSRGLLAPYSTLPSIFGLIVTSALAFRIRKTMPTLFAGWFLFLLGHAVESTFLPLELYYEHRNYLPSVGLLICTVILGRELLAWLERKGIRSRRIAGASITGALLVLMIQTGGRVHVWQRLDTILSSSVDAHPLSLHANYAYLNALITNKHYDEAEARLAVLRQSPDRKLRAGSSLYSISFECSLRHQGSPQALDAAMKMLPPDRIELTTVQALGSLVDNAERKPTACGALGFREIADRLRELADRAEHQPTVSYTRYATRNQAARMYLAAGDPRNAEVQARLSWQRLSPPSYSSPLIRALLLEGRYDEAEQILAEARAKTNRFNQFDQDGLAKMQELLDGFRASHPAAPQ